MKNEHLGETRPWGPIPAHHSIAVGIWMSYLDSLSISFPSFFIHRVVIIIGSTSMLSWGLSETKQGKRLAQSPY